MSASRSAVGIRGLRVHYELRHCRTHTHSPMTMTYPSARYCPSLRLKTFYKKRNKHVKQQLSTFLQNIQKLKDDIVLLELELLTSKMKVTTTLDKSRGLTRTEVVALRII